MTITSFALLTVLIIKSDCGPAGPEEGSDADGEIDLAGLTALLD